MSDPAIWPHRMKYALDLLHHLLHHFLHELLYNVQKVVQKVICYGTQQGKDLQVSQNSAGQGSLNEVNRLCVLKVFQKALFKSEVEN